LKLFGARGALWSQSDFLRLWCAQTVSSFGARITRTALPMAAILAINASPLSLGILSALSQAPALVVGLLAGGFVDRTSRRKILIASDLLRAALLLTVPVAAILHRLTMPELYAVATIVGGLSVLFEIADHAYLPSLIGQADLIEGNTKLNLTDSIAEIGGPAVGGLLVQLLTAPIAIVANAITYLISAFFLSGIAKSEAPPDHTSERVSLLQDLAAGARAIFHDEIVRSLFLMFAILPLFGSFFAALYTFYAIRILGLSPTMLGVTIGVGGVGAIAGAAIAPMISRRIGIGPAIIVTSLAGTLFYLLVPLARGSTTTATAMLMAAQFGGDALMVVAVVLATTVRQTSVPNQVLGRVAAAFQAAAGLCGVTGALLGGFLGGLIDARATLWIAVAGYFLLPAIGLFSPLKALKSLPKSDKETAH
jgi:MFS family permease